MRRPKHMYYVYILRSLKDRKLYIGKSNNLKRRFSDHNAGRVISTKKRKPFELIFYEAFKNKTDAGRDELFFKSGYGREIPKDKLFNSLK
jgi:putative endonuclease